MSLTEYVSAIQTGTCDWNDLYPHLYEYVWRFACRGGLDEDEAHEFFFEILGRLMRMTKNYKDQGKSFEALLNTSLMYQLRSYKRKKCLNRTHEYHIGCEILYEQSHVSHGLVAERSVVQAKGAIASMDDCSVDARRCIVSAMRNCLSMDDERCAALSKAFGLDNNWILSCRDELRARIHPRYVQSRTVADIRSGRRVMAILRGCPPPRSATIRVHPRHSDLAEVLGIPKGTVDSIMFACRKLAKSGYVVQTSDSRLPRTPDCV